MTKTGVILVVEDDALIRMSAVDLVEASGFSAIEAENADTAIRILEQRPDIRLVFTDIDMPGSMDGLKLAHYVRGRWPPVKLIIASGHMIVAEDEMPRGARFFGKPYVDHAITGAIQQMMDEVV